MISILVRAHPFFESICWQKVETRQLCPPYVPSLDGPTDVSNFDEKHTEDRNRIGSNIEATFDFNHPQILSEYHVDHFDYTFPNLVTNNSSKNSIR